MNSVYCGCLFFASNALSRVLSRLAEEAFAPVGFSPSHGFLMMLVLKHPGIQPTELAQQLELTRSTVTRLIDKLEHKGYLERRSQGKMVQIYPTSRAEALAPQLKTAWEGIFSKYAAILGEAESHRLTQEIYATAKKLEG